MAIRVAVDAMGGDDAPAVVIEGALGAAREAAGNLELLLFGPAALLHDALAAYGDAARACTVVDAPEVVGMGEAPVAAVKTKHRSSIHLGLRAHQEGRADAFVSAGNTGAVMAAALFILGRLPGVARPTLPAYFPTTRGVCILLDVGSNVDCKPEHLVQFAQMGTRYARRIRNIASPTVGLLNVGGEPGKGNDLVKAAYALLEQTPDLDFQGNVEGHHLSFHRADVVVCDGFVGNVLLKYGESVPRALMKAVGQEMERQGLSDPQKQIVEQVLSGPYGRFNPEVHGGVPLLGIDGNVIIGHGGSSQRAIANMILTAAETVAQNLKGAIAEAVGP